MQECPHSQMPICQFPRQLKCQSHPACMFAMCLSEKCSLPSNLDEWYPSDAHIPTLSASAATNLVSVPLQCIVQIDWLPARALANLHSHRTPSQMWGGLSQGQRRPTKIRYTRWCTHASNSSKSSLLVMHVFAPVHPCHARPWLLPRTAARAHPADAPPSPWLWWSLPSVELLGSHGIPTLVVLQIQCQKFMNVYDYFNSNPQKDMTIRQNGATLLPATKFPPPFAARTPQMPHLRLPAPGVPRRLLEDSAPAAAVLEGRLELGRCRWISEDPRSDPWKYCPCSCSFNPLQSKKRSLWVHHPQTKRSRMVYSLYFISIYISLSLSVYCRYVHVSIYIL